jgi:hypothetical protein
MLPCAHTCDIQTAGSSPTAARRIVQFGARHSVSAGILSTRYEHHCVEQRGRRVIHARGVKVAGGSPTAARRIVEFRARGRGEIIIKASCNQHPAVE